MITLRDIKIRYKQSVMGFLWAILMPILIIGSGLIVTIAFSTISGRTVSKLDVLAVAVKAVPWAFFVGAIRFGTNSLVSNKELVSKVYFPRQILPIASVVASAFDFAVAGGALALILVALRVVSGIQLFWLPVLLGLLALLAAGLAIFLSCANLFFRDVKYLVEIFLTYGIFFTPVFYSAAKLGKWGPIVLLNPVGPLLESINSVVILHQRPEYGWLAYAAACAVLGFMLAWRIFRRAEAAFAESV